MPEQTISGATTEPINQSINQSIPHPPNYLGGAGAGKVRELFQVGVAPVHFRVPARRVPVRVEVHELALLRGRDHVPPQTAHLGERHARRERDVQREKERESAQEKKIEREHMLVLGQAREREFF